MLLKRQLAKLMMLVYPKLHRQYVQYSSKMEATLSVYMTKALYGMIKSALWFYKELREELEDCDFNINPYDHCIANESINENR